jgi:hypothetical protein
LKMNHRKNTKCPPIGIDRNLPPTFQVFEIKGLGRQWE